MPRFINFYQSTQNSLALKTARYIKYGTANPRYIYMLRYGMDFDDIKNLDPYIENIDETHIEVKDSFYQLEEENRQIIERYL